MISMHVLNVTTWLLHGVSIRLNARPCCHQVEDGADASAAKPVNFSALGDRHGSKGMPHVYRIC